MARPKAQPTGRESFFDTEEIIVSKTDLKGHITYANEVFLRVARLTESQAIGAPHNIIRHPDMPRAVFKLLWDRIQAGHEIFAYVLNMASNGDHYWVFAHVTPTRDGAGNIVGYHSNRRKPDAAQIAKVEPIYRELAAEERRHASPKEGLERSMAMINELVRTKGISYDEFVFSV